MAAVITTRRRHRLLSGVLFHVVVVLAAAAVVAVAAQASSNNTTSNATTSSDEEYWAARASAALSRNLAAYESDPVSATNRFNAAVVRSTTPATTRRALARYTGPCMATNPIDRCWRCRADWAADRKRLARCARGFGHRTVGGAAGELYVVTDAGDDDMVTPRPGTLRHAVVQDRPLWVVFARDMVIALRQELIVNSLKTLDGRGAQVHLVGAQITLQSVHDVIIHNLHVHDAAPHSGGMIRDSERHYGQRTRSDGDGVSVLSSSNVWVDHVSMWSCADGLVDVVNGSTAITVSNSHFTRHDHVMLFGASNGHTQDAAMQVTVAFNHFGRGLVQRMPRCRYGFFHVVNNDYTHWRMYAIGGNKNPTIISQGNRFIAPDDPNAKEVTKREYTPYKDYKEWVWKSQGDVMMNGAFFNQSGGRNERKYDRLDFIPARHGRYVGQLTRFAGALKCVVGQPC